MRLLTLLLIITKIFILFNLVSNSNAFKQHHHNSRSNNRNAPDDGYNGNNNNQALPSLSSLDFTNKVASTERDNIVPTLPLGITQEVIRNGKLEEAPSSTRNLYNVLTTNKNPEAEAEAEAEAEEEQNDNQEQSLLSYHHHSSVAELEQPLSIDNNALAASSLYQSEVPAYTNTNTNIGFGTETNSLIEWRAKKQNPLNSTTTTIQLNKPGKSHHYHHHHHHDHHIHHVGTRRNGININPLFNRENYGGSDGRLRSKRQNDWCHKVCNLSTLTSVTTTRYDHNICASDGRFYGSSCELKRYSCRHNIQLSERPKVYCSKQKQQQVINGNISNSNDNNGAGGSTEEVRIVELKRRCTRHELDEMKMLLLHQFNGDIASMFKYFDSNGDGYIEAHELWPRKEIESNRLMYAQVWDDHSSKCPTYKPDHDHQHDYHLLEDHSKCWFFLDFAFEPEFETNSCSLSHLMLFDLTHPNSRFDWQRFKQAFTSTNEEPNIGTTSSGDLVATVKSFSTLNINLGDSADLYCFDNNSNDLLISEVKANLIEEENDLEQQIKCLWTRYNLNLGSLRDPHIGVSERLVALNQHRNVQNLVLHLKDAQLYLSGKFKCTCNLQNGLKTFEHIFTVQVLAPPRVHVRPRSQWSLPNSRVSFECHYDHIDTSNGGIYDKRPRSDILAPLNESRDDPQQRGQYGLKVDWLKDNQKLIVDYKRYFREIGAGVDEASLDSDSSTESSHTNNYSADDIFYSHNANISLLNNNEVDEQRDNERLDSSTAERKILKPKLAQISERASITLLSSRLSLENLRLSDSGQYTCRVEVPFNSTYSKTKKPSTRGASDEIDDNDGDYSGDERFSLNLFGEDHGTLLVQERPKTDQSNEEEYSPKACLWMFHDNGISIYKIQNDDGQEMELLREINGHSLVSGEVDGNWNQLTLCGGLNPEQVVICEWSDNALYLDVDFGDRVNNNENSKSRRKGRKYVYVGQPNLNRIIVMDGLMFEIVAIINTEPQPRKLHLYKPNKIHLSKWVRRRLSPIANARWMSAVGVHAHSLKLTPESELYSAKPLSYVSRRHERSARRIRQQNRGRREAGGGGGGGARAFSTSTRTGSNQMHSALIQHDIWLLCYGQPIVVDPSGEEPSNVEDSSSFYSTIVNISATTNGTSASATSSTTPSIATTNNPANSHKTSSINIGAAIHPFTPRLTTGGSPFAWSAWPNKESKLRNRKSVHIIQSTFFPKFQTESSDGFHSHNQDDYRNREEENTRNSEDSPKPTTRLRSSSSGHRGHNIEDKVVGMFKKSTVLTTHHVFAGVGRTKAQRYLNSAQFDLIQDLHVPPKPYSLAKDGKHKIHYAYVTHYDDQRLFRVSMDEYSYDREIDLQDCDPINLMTTTQGLLVVQCRAPITHNLIGQLVLDQLTSSRIEFNANIRAQESYVSPDNRYLISIYTNLTSPKAAAESSIDKSLLSTEQKRKRSNQEQPNKQQHGQSIIYVQLVSTSGLKLQYEIKTFLEISQCSFAWKDGYYAAIFVSSNRRDQQSEILSLRLADGRLELMARVPGLISATRHKDQLIISSELQLAALSTNQGTYVVDLEDNRVSQSLRHHQAPPTLLWV